MLQLAYLAGDPDVERYNPQLALDMYNKLKEAPPELHILMAWIYFDENDFDKAIDCCKEARKCGSRAIESTLYYYMKRSPEQAFKAGKSSRDGYTEHYVEKVMTGYEKIYDGYGRWVDNEPIYNDVSKTRIVPPNRKEALFLFKIAKKKGHKGATKALLAMERGR